MLRYVHVTRKVHRAYFVSKSFPVPQNDYYSLCLYLLGQHGLSVVAVANHDNGYLNICSVHTFYLIMSTDYAGRLNARKKILKRSHQQFQLIKNNLDRDYHWLVHFQNCVWQQRLDYMMVSTTTIGICLSSMIHFKLESDANSI